MDINEQILKRALEKWGIDAQVKMVREECLELAIEISKFYDRDGSQERHDKILDEMADVIIMLRQMEINSEWKDKIQARIDFKMKRLEGRLDRSEF